MHIRREIKERIQSLLVGRTDAAERVYRNRTLPLSDHEDAPGLPAISVLMFEEDVSPRGEVDWTQVRRSPKVRIACVVKGETEDLAGDLLDELTNQVEMVLQADDTLGGLVESVSLSKVEIVHDEAADSLIQGGILTYGVTYLASDTSTIALDDLERTECVMRTA
jgi:hypothetical protein